MQPVPYENAPTDLELYGLGDDMFTGLEDFSAEDARLGRLSIHHKDGGWIEDSLTGGQYQKITFIPLAFIKQRILWRPVLVEDPVPMCKSTDYKIGYPTLDQKDAKSNFPFGPAGINPDDMETNPENGRMAVPCAACSLKEWGTHPTLEASWCSQQRIIPMLFGADGEEPSQLAVMSFQKTSLGPCNMFFAGISAKKIKGTTRAMPAFSVVGELSLSPRIKGTNDYMVPVFKRVHDTSMNDWLSYSQEAQRVYEYVTRPPRGPESEPFDPTDNVSGTGKNGYQPPATQMSAPPGATTYVDSVVVPAPVQQPAPQMQQPVQQAPVVPPTPQQTTSDVDPWATSAPTNGFDDDLPF